MVSSTTVIHTPLYMQPPSELLQRLFNAHLKRKAYLQLADVVQLSLDYNVTLNKLFYQKV